jgi:hypothetical protein
MRRWLRGTAVALGVSFPVVIVAQVLSAVLDDLDAGLQVVLVVLVLVGAVVGGASVSTARLDLAPVAAGATALGVLGTFGLALQAVRDDEAEVVVLPGIVLLGAVLGLLGWALHLAWAARTRS